MDNIDNPEWVLGTSENRDSYLEPHRKQYPSPDHYQVNHGSIEVWNNKYLETTQKVFISWIIQI